ncbi:hypothetical protein Tco_0502307, partial [Tanacetum coccineum]
MGNNDPNIKLNNFGTPTVGLAHVYSDFKGASTSQHGNTRDDLVTTSIVFYIPLDIVKFAIPDTLWGKAWRKLLENK